MNDLMNKIMLFRSKVDHVWKTPNTLDCLRYAAQEANELRDLWMRQQNPDHARHNERDDSMGQELADTVIMLLTALRAKYKPQTFAIPSGGLYDGVCGAIEGAIGGLYHEGDQESVLDALGFCLLISNDLDVDLDDIVKARLKDIAQRNGFDVGIVDEVWQVDPNPKP